MSTDEMVKLFPAKAHISERQRGATMGWHVQDDDFDDEGDKGIKEHPGLELKKIEAEEFPVKEAEEVACVLRQQYDSGRLAVKRRSRIDANEGLLPDVERAEALNKSAE
ncbi:hypothetical protein C1H46_019439 [Malus baccata]|uniref:Uncharacterized protein n=1 Tax=Malus baccata TaxID=106549 RepID=A0A540M861_MALBA|nr:hypothetical protein C1H46_019439 [Malus baccata]